MITEIILLALAIPTGLILAWLADDELKDGKKWFVALFYVSLALALFFLFYGKGYIVLTFVFIAIVSFISAIKATKRKSFK
ncbi:hypothetical protein J4229_03500 [Candidatus Pacearchaeota archaeon]|nr:hypothetical protein [Candidatus Pacearchaeota archaeon]